MAEQRVLKRIETQKASFTGYPMLKETGEKVWHGVYPNRTAFPLPSMSKGPIRAKAARKAKGLPGYS